MARGDSSSIFSGTAMRSISALLACVSLLSGTAAWADSRVFIIANQSYCQSRDFALASSYRRVDPDEITGSVPKEHENCGRSGCGEYIAITCQR
jgi:hypothetical protein